jgi:hypothetical protein
MTRAEEGQGPGEEKLGCATLLEETRSACRESMRQGLRVDCHPYVVALQTGARQRRGELFEVKGADNDALADASCRVHVIVSSF